MYTCDMKTKYNLFKTRMKRVIRGVGRPQPLNPQIGPVSFGRIRPKGHKAVVSKSSGLLQIKKRSWVLFRPR